MGELSDRMRRFDQSADEQAAAGRRNAIEFQVELARHLDVLAPEFATEAAARKRRRYSLGFFTSAWPVQIPTGVASDAVLVWIFANGSWRLDVAKVASYVDSEAPYRTTYKELNRVAIERATSAPTREQVLDALTRHLQNPWLLDYSFPTGSP